MIKYLLYTITIFLFFSTSCIKSDNKEKHVIKRGKFIATITETGELEAVNSRIIIMPFVGWKYGWRFQITGLLEHGSVVKKGDSIGQMDPGNILKYLIDKESLIEVEKANLNKLAAQHKGRLKELQTELKISQSNFDMKKLELEKFKFESEKKKEIKQLEFEQSEIQLNKIIRKIKLEEKVIENELLVQKIKVKQLEKDAAEAREAKEKLTLHTPINGIVQLSFNRRTRQTMQVSDEVHMGQDVAGIPDLSLMRVKSSINETDIGKVKNGQKVIIKLDAFPEKAFDGEISYVGKLSYKKDKKATFKVFDLEIAIKNSDPVLKPGMTVSCEIIYAEYDDIFYVPNECVLKTTEGYYIYTKTKKGTEKLKIKIGAENNKNTVIYGNFKNGTHLIPISEINNTKNSTI